MRRVPSGFLADFVPRYAISIPHRCGDAAFDRTPMSRQSADGRTAIERLSVRV